MAGVKISVYFDYVCPFCFIALPRMERLEREMGVEMEWKGLEIHPETPGEGVAAPFYLERYIGDPGGSIQCLAEEEGMAVKVPAITANSHLALVLAELARERGKFGAYHRSVFEAYWQRGENIGEPDFLFSILENLGISTAEVKSYLASGEGEAKLESYRREARELGIAGVPTFVFPDGLVLEGVQAYPVFQRAVERAGRQC